MHYDLVKKWQSNPMPELGAEFLVRGAKYKVVGANKAGDKLRATNEEGKVFLFKIKNFEETYHARYLPSATA